MGRDGFDIDRLTVLLEENRPRWIAFNGKNSASGAFGHPVDYGRQDEPFAGIPAFVLIDLRRRAPLLGHLPLARACEARLGGRAAAGLLSEIQD